MSSLHEQKCRKHNLSVHPYAVLFFCCFCFFAQLPEIRKNTAARAQAPDCARLQADPRDDDFTQEWVCRKQLKCKHKTLMHDVPVAVHSIPFRHVIPACVSRLFGEKALESMHGIYFEKESWQSVKHPYRTEN